jgi:hypothetical protein
VHETNLSFPERFTLFVECDLSGTVTRLCNTSCQTGSSVICDLLIYAGLITVVRVSNNLREHNPLLCFRLYPMTAAISLQFLYSSMCNDRILLVLFHKHLRTLSATLFILRVSVDGSLACCMNGFLWCLIAYRIVIRQN